MPTTNELVLMCDRNLQSTAELKANAVKLGQLENEIPRAQTTLAGLQAKIAQAETMAAEIQALDQRIRAKRAELADLVSSIARKHEQHGSIDADLRSLIKRATSVTEIT
jgi:chromosome segregation ATPase